MMVTLRDPETREQVCVNTVELVPPDGAEGWVSPYQGWDALAEHDGPPPEHATLADGIWVVDEAAKADADEAARLRSMPRERMIAEFDAKLADLRAELAKRGVQIAEIAATTGAVVTPIEITQIARGE